MLKTPFTPGRPARPRHFRARAEAARKLPSALLLGVLAAAVMLMAPALANADTSSTLTVIGTSDVSDSGLIPNVIQPGFTKAFPQFTFKYIGTGTGNAIAQAESGAAGASNLIVHAASLENQFVSGGYSFEQYGRALWTNDFVLASNRSGPGRRCRQRGHQHCPGVRRRCLRRDQRRWDPEGDVRLARRHARHHRVRARHLAARLQFRAEPGGPAAVHRQRRQRRRRDADRGQSRRDRIGTGVPQQRCAADRGRAADVVRRNWRDPGAQRPAGQRLQRLPQRSQFLLRVHRQRHVSTTWPRGPIRRERFRR